MRKAKQMRVLWLLVLLWGVACAQSSPARRALDEGRPLACLRLAGSSFSERLLAIEALSRMGRKSQARRRLDRLVGESRTRPDPERRAFHVLRGQLEASRTDYDLARKDLQEAIRLALTPAEKAQALLELAFIELQAEQGERAAELLGMALKQAPTSLGLRIARVQSEILTERGQLDAARGTVLTGLALAQQQGNRGRQAELQNMLAALDAQQGEWPQAERHFRAALELGLQLQEPNLVLAALAQRQGAVLGRHHEIPAHIRLLEKVLLRLQRPQDKARVAQMLAALQLHVRQVANARATQQLSLAWAGQSRDPVEILRAQTSWAGFLWRSDEASAQAWRKAYQKALELSGKVTVDTDDVGAGTMHPARLHLRLADSYSSERGVYHAQRALALATPDERAYVASQALAWALRFKKLKPAQQALEAFFAALPTCPQPSTRASVCLAVSNLLFMPAFTEQILTGQTAFGLDEIRSALVRAIRPEQLQLMQGETERYLARLTRRPEPSSLWSGYLMQGLMFDAQGRHAEALDALTRSAEAARAGKLDYLAGTSWQMAGLILFEEKRYLEAAEAFERSARLTAADQPTIESGSLMVLALVHRARGAPQEALAVAERGLARQQQDSRVPSHMRAWLLAERAHCRLELQEPELALEDYREAARLMAQAGQTQYRTLMLRKQAETLARLNRLEEAGRLFEEVLSALKGRMRLEQEIALDYGPVLRRLGHFEQARALYERAFEASRELRSSLPELDDELDRRLVEQGVELELSQSRPQAAQRWLERARSLEQVRATTAQERAGLDIHTRLALERAEELRAGLGGLHQELAATGSQEVAQQLADTRSRFLLAVNEVKSRNPDFESLLTVRESELVKVQQRLPDDVVLLQYYPAPEALYLLVVTRRGFEMRSLQVARTRLYALIREFRQLLSEHSRSERLAELSSLLYSLTLAPVRSDFKARRLRVIPSGLLWYLPLEALKDEDGRYLAQTTEIGYVTGLDLVATPALKNPERVLAVGAPLGLDLPGTRAELQRILAMLPGTRLLEGAQATRAALLEQAESADVLHLASHSALNRQDVNSTYIQLTGERLTLGDIYRLRLAPGSLVVLSSCESGLGEDNPGREFASLAAAFRMAGASSVVSTLWKVDDRVGPELFGEFYRQLQSGASRARALQQAKLAVMRRPGFEHPGDWAAYTLLGD